MTKNILTGAAREAVRIAAVPAPGGGSNGSAATARGNQILASAGITTAIIRAGHPVPYGDVTATVNYNFPVVVAGFIPGLSGSTFPLSSTTTMRREY